MSDLDELARAGSQQVTRPGGRPVSANLNVSVHHQRHGPSSVLVVAIIGLVLMLSVAIEWWIYDRYRTQRAVDEVKAAAIKAAQSLENRAAANAQKDAVWRALDTHFPGGLIGPDTIKAAVGTALPDEVVSVNTPDGDLSEKRLVYKSADVYVGVKPSSDGDRWIMTRAVDTKTSKEISLAAAASRIMAVSRAN